VTSTKPKIILIIGYHRSGKTSTIETLIPKLRKLGLKIATIKHHVSKEDFTVDVEGKDSWRHGAAGAEATLLVAPKEITLIRRIETSGLNWEEIYGTLVGNYDVILVEGFKSLAGKRSDMWKLILARKLEEAEEILSYASKPILAIVGWRVEWGKKSWRNIPLIKLPEEEKRLFNLLRRKILENHFQ
jgi:molybdopterin-guanine dinucleotide biosynthesis protein B